MRDALITAVFYAVLLLPAYIIDWLLEPVVGRNAAHVWGGLALILSIIAATRWGRWHRARKLPHGRD